MVLTPHLLAGAAIGAKTHNLGLIVVLGLLSHLVLDRIAHWDYPNAGLSNYRQEKNLKNLFIEFTKIVIDGIIGLTVIWIISFWKKDLLEIKNIFSMLIGVFFATLPDISLLFSYLILPEKISEKLVNFHHSFFHYKRPEKDKDKPLGLFLEILMVFLIILVFFF